MKKIILIFPKLGSYFVGRPPLSVLCLTSYLKRAGIPVVVFDFNNEPNWKKKILNEAKNALCVGISAMISNQITSGLEITNLLKEKFPNLPIVWGGSHSSSAPGQVLAEKNIDIVVRGEGEETLLELVKAMNNNKPLDNILGISFKKDGRIVHNPTRPFLVMDELPNPAWNLIDIDNYYFSNLSSKNIALQTSRGCPHRCAFCIQPKLSKQSWRCMSAERVIDMIKPLVEEQGIDGIVFWDDNFFVNFDRVKKFCQLLIENNLNIKWEADCRVEYLCRMDDSFLKLLKSAGLDALFVGAESGSQKTLNSIKKDITTEQIIKSAEITAKYKFKVWYAFLIGFPGESRENVLETIKMMKKVNKINPLASTAIKVFSPFPGSYLYEEAKKAGFVLPKDLAGWGCYVTDDVKTPWIVHEFSPYFSMCARFAVQYNRFSGLSKNFVVKFFVRILHYIEKFRWDYNFYYFPIELVLVKKIAKKLGFY